jgi:hypothetical protein
MKKIHLIEAIQSFLMSDNAGDLKGMYHPEEIKVWMNSAFDTIIYNAWRNGKKYNEFSQIDAWSKTYEVTLVQVGATGHAFLPFAPVALPDGMGIRQVADHDDNSTVFAPMEATANVVFAELEVNTMDAIPTYWMEQSNLNTGAGEESHLLRLAKLPVAPAILITALDVMMVQNLEQMDDFDDISIPENGEDSILRAVLDILSKKPVPDTSNDAVIERR